MKIAALYARVSGEQQRDIHSPSIRWCRDVNTRSGCSLACSAIHCCFVDVVVELSVSSIVSHQWVWTCDASLSSDGSRWPRFPAVSGTMKALRLPVPHALRLMVSPAGSTGSCFFSCPLTRSRRCAGQSPGRGLCWSRWPSPSSGFPHGQKQDLTGSLATHPVALRLSKTPDDPSHLACSGASGAAPRPNKLKASSVP